MSLVALQNPMTSNNGIPPLPPPPDTHGLSPLRLPKQRHPVEGQLLASSTASLPYRNSISSVFASTSTPPESRSISPSSRTASSKALDLAGSVFVGTPTEDLPQASSSEWSEDPRHFILQAFVPHIAVYTSQDTEDLANDKGFPNGLWQLLRPFGEHVQGKVTVRDSVGLSRVCDDFAVRFVELGDNLENPSRPSNPARNVEGQLPTSNGPTTQRFAGTSGTGGDIDMVENVVNKHLSYAEACSGLQTDGGYFRGDFSSDGDSMSPFYRLYLRKLLSGIPLAPHETFSHPVACIIAISSRNMSPIETLRRLYDESSRGDKRLPIWVNSEYLRYYVLVHDEEKDDISKSITLFDQMKRHFGLHCHLLRLRSSQCVPTDDDCYPLPPCDWTSASEEMAEIQAKEVQEDLEDTSPCIFESDATAIRTFIREMVTQSVVPSMERAVSTWNDQVASRRRGIGGRILNVTKKWTYFGAGSRNSTTTSAAGGSGGSGSNYDAVQGFYRPEAPEAIMRKLADYAFMLRDWKLAQSTYELLRTDFNSDKAWKYHAAANEMAAISSLLIPHAISSKVRSETIDQMLETASYSYLTRCSASYGALRSLSLGMELLRLRPGSAADDAARWGSKLLESQILGSIGDALFKERVASCYATQKGSGSGAWGSRTRKAALWNVLAASEWLKLGKFVQAGNRLAEVRRLYDRLASQDCLVHFSAAHAFLATLERELLIASPPNDVRDGQDLVSDQSTSSMDEESEALDVRSHRMSLVGATVPPLASLETAPLHTLQAHIETPNIRDDDFV